MAETIATREHAPPASHVPRWRALPRVPFAHPRLTLFAAAFALALAASLHVIGSVGTTGDEPWYLLQAYCLLHFHTVDLTPVLRDHSIYARFLGNVPDDHTYDFTGNGVRVLAYLPGYALVIAPLYALGGRALIGAAQAAAVALVAPLLYGEAMRLYGSGRIALFAALAYLSALPVLLYAGELFPTSFAMLLSFAGYVLVVRRLRSVAGRRLVWSGVALGAIACALPWLHAKYALIGAILPILGIVALLPRLRERPLLGRRDSAAWWAAGAIVALSLLGLALLLAYDRHYFGTWYPQYRQGDPGAFSPPQLDRATTLYGRMFFDAQSGLLPWAPLLLLAVPGFVLLLRRARGPALAAAACLLALLGSFLSVVVAPHVGLAYAYPARFVVESIPFLALCAAGVLAGATERSGALARRATARAPRLALVVVCLALLAADSWITAVGQLDPSVIYPTSAGARLAAEFPALLPAGWFALFPEGEAPILYRGIAKFDDSASYGTLTTIAGARPAYLARPGTTTPGAPVAQSQWLAVPSGRFIATFEVACDGASASVGAVPFTLVALQQRQPARVPVATLQAGAAVCAGMDRPITVRLQFPSDGYRRIALGLLYGGTSRVEVLSISYAPASAD